MYGDVFMILDLFKRKSKEEKLGDKIKRAIFNGNHKEVVALLKNDEKFFISDTELYSVSDKKNLLIEAIDEFEDPDLCLKLLMNSIDELNTIYSLNLVVKLNNAYDLLEEIIKRNQKNYSKEENKKALNESLFYVKDHEYLYFLVNAGADINNKDNEYNKEFIIFAAENFVERDIHHKLRHFSDSDGYTSYFMYKQLLITSFNLGVNGNVSNDEGLTFYDIIAKGYDKKFDESMAMLQQEQYRNLFECMFYNGVVPTYKFSDPVKQKNIHLKFVEIEKNLLEKSIDDNHNCHKMKHKRL